MATKEDLLLGQIAIRLGFITPTQLDECLRIQQESTPQPPLGAVLINRHYINHIQLERLLSEQRAEISKVLRQQARVIMVCIRCASRYKLPYKGAAVRYACPKCSGALSPEEMPQTLYDANTAELPSIKTVPPEVTDALSKDPANDLGNYVLVQSLGGNLHRAWQKDAERWVSLKILRGLSDLDSRRIMEAAQKWSSLQHPNILKVYDVATSDRDTLIATAFVEGRSIDQLESPIGEVLLAMRDAAEAIAHAHLHNVFHGNLKPGNILFDAAQRVFVRDFGCSLPSYASPYRAPEGTESVAADMYGLGAVLYRILTGKDPSRAYPRSIRRSIPPRVEGMILMAMHPVPSRRYKSGDELADDIMNFLRGCDTLAKPVSWWGRILGRR